MLHKILLLTDDQADYILTPSVHFFVGYILYLLSKTGTTAGIIDDKLKGTNNYSKLNMYIGGFGLSYFIGSAFDAYGGDVHIELLKWFLFSLIAIFFGINSSIRRTKKMSREDMLNHKYL